MNYPIIDWPNTNVHQLNLDWVLGQLKRFHAWLKAIAGQVDENTENIEQLQKQVAAIEELLQKIEEGGFDDLYLSAIQKWVEDNLPGLVRDLVKYVMFGLTTDGYFCAVIPEVWDFLSFDTVADPASPMYGHLILRW
ncbi:hypothetical protein [Muribaculum intestinale]|uniref:hypothetical protein n=1 Tax=Muribaculum intestinale TaxID=1796646 RepID=UPI0025B6FF9A|nr:hypothetical protein [Muribaculum intestinale]